MGVNRYLGGVISADPNTPTVESASGTWTLAEAYQNIGNWPMAQSQIQNSLRFNSADSAYLSRTPSVAGNRKTWTISVWVKRSTLGGDGWVYDGGSTSNSSGFEFSDDKIRIQSTSSSGAVDDVDLKTTAVYRDPSAWYHVVLAVDTTQTTSTNRVKLYVNGSQVTSFSTTTYPSLNYEFGVNNTNSQKIGKWNISTGRDFNGYLTEFNLIDGLALDADYFGFTDANGIWQPRPYKGAYGTNGFYLPMQVSGAYSGYFSSAYVNTPTDASFALTTSQFAIEWWEYRTSTSNVYPVWGGKGQATYDPIVGYLDSGNNVVYMSGNGSSWGILGGFNVGSVNVGQWNHFLLTRDSSNVVRGFKNGVLTSNTNIGASSIYMSANGLTIGRAQSSNYFLGYVSNARVCIGSIPTAYQTSSTTNGTTIFTPSTTQLTTTSQGATSSDVKLLTMQNSTIIDNSANAWSLTTSNVLTQQYSPFYLDDVVDDYSGNNNNWAPNNLNLSTSGSGADIMVDTPTNYGTDTGVGGEVRGNYATLNPLDYYTSVPTNGNLDFTTASAAYAKSRSTIWFDIGSSDGWYAEFTLPASGTIDNLGVGVADSSVFANNYYNAGAYGIATRGAGGSFTWYKTNPSGYDGSTSVAQANGQVIGIAVKNGKVYFSINGSWILSGNPATESNPTFSGLTGNYTFFVYTYQSNSLSSNFGQTPFAYTAPSGYKALCTQNLPTPTILDGADYMNATLWTGNGATQTITTGLANDLVWTKDRGAAYDHTWFDVLRTPGYFLRSNSTSAEEYRADSLTAFTSTGFSVGADSVRQNINKSGNSYVSWVWKAGGTGVTNTAGTITGTVTVSANTTAGFSIVTYTGNGSTSSTVTIGHGLGATPAFIITKNRVSTTAGNNYWSCWHKDLGANYGIWLDLTNGRNANMWVGYTNISSTVFSPPDLTYGNVNGDTYVNYLFAPVAGYSAFGSYTGNGSADGPFVYLGFRPRFLMVKRTDTTSNWVIVDSSRNVYNPQDLNLYPNLSAAEDDYTTTYPFDMLSNGVKFRANYSNVNASGGTYIFAAFAENPFKLSRAR